MAGGKKKQGVSFRFKSGTVERLKGHAAASNASQTELVERYIEEGIRSDEHPLIYFRAGAAGRRPALLGSRLDVATAITTIRQSGGSTEAASEYLEIPIEQLEAATRYYGEFTQEVDTLIERSSRVAERERELWQRGQAALA